MKQGDPEERGPDLERQDAEAVGQAPRDQAPRLNRGSLEKAVGDHQPSGRGQQPSWKSPVVALLRVVLILIAFFVPLTFFGLGAYDNYAYRVGTPTTATDVSCVEGGRNSTYCTGTWNIDAKSYTGKINCSNLAACDPSDVRVHGGEAYTATAGLGAILFGTFTIIVMIAVFVFVRVRDRMLAEEP